MCYLRTSTCPRPHRSSHGVLRARHSCLRSLFEEKQKYMYTAFERTLLSDKGKALVREHTIDYDAQTVFKDLSALPYN
jgi:hypothetical protein